MTPRERYEKDLKRPNFHTDAAQREAVECLQELYRSLLAPSQANPWWRRLTGRYPMPERGLYIWGGSGRGKTYLMDIFYECLPFDRKRRVHFHRFMLEIHTALGTLPKTPNPLPIVAQQISDSCRVLCLDEFHVTDIADAMLLAGLLEALFRRRITLVATSNIEPVCLYKNGLQRERFLPAIDLLLTHARVYHLSGEQDFRMLLLQRSGTYLLAEGGRSEAWFADHLRELAPVEAQWGGCIQVHGRFLKLRAKAEDIAWFEFDELCVQPRSVRDYLELAREFHTLLLEGVPVFDENMDEAARRFMHLVDALYDHGVKLIVSAADNPERLYQGHRLRESFTRTASRLTEMSSAAYLARPHRPD